VLAHELGHAIDLRSGISERVAKAYVKDPQSKAFEIVCSWAGELAADLIACDAIGVSSIMSLISFEYCVLPRSAIHQPSATHPATIWRLEAVLNRLDRQAPLNDSVKAERDAYSLAHDYSVEVFATDPSKWHQVSGDIRREVIQPLVTAIEKELAPVPPLEAGQAASLDRCLRRLQQGLPISAQGERREDLRQALDEFDNKAYASPEVRRGAFKELSQRFREQPLEIETILAAGQVFRSSCIADFVSSAALTFEKDNSRLRRLDELVRTSISTMKIHKSLMQGVGQSAP
jgi:hypothetical protein